MKALVLREKGVWPQWEDFAEPETKGTEEVCISLVAAALNHRDLWIVKGLYPGIRYPIILGSDGAGLLNGREVIINPGMNWGEDERVQSKKFSILGLPANGTLAEYVKVPAGQVYDKPAHLSMEEAAALPLAGLTAYRVLFSRCRLQAGERVLISGVGGGVALMACQMALAAGAEVYVTSGSDAKLEKARALGAVAGVNYRNKNWSDSLKKMAGGFDVIIDSAAGSGFGRLFALCRPAARMGIYGGTCGPLPELSPQFLFWNQISILGSTMGSDRDFRQMLDFVNRHQLRPLVDAVFPLSRGPEAFAYLDQGQQFGKVVLRMG